VRRINHVTRYHRRIGQVSGRAPRKAATIQGIRRIPPYCANCRSLFFDGPHVVLRADRSDSVFNIIILRDSHPTWLFSRRPAHYGI